MSCYPKNNCGSNASVNCNNTDSVTYTGQQLQCTGINCGDSLSVVLQKLDAKYCEILSIIQNCNTTTTSTTLAPVPCASPFAQLLKENPPSN
jgi:hypothetical protein